MSNNQRLAMHGRSISYIGDDASNVGYHPDGFDAYLTPSPNYNAAQSYIQNNQPVGSYDIPDSVFYYDENSSKHNDIPKSTATTVQIVNPPLSPVDKLYDRFSFNNIGYNPQTSANRSFAPNQPINSNSAAHRSKRTISQNSALDFQMYTIRESPAAHLKIPLAEKIERKTKSVPDLSYPSYNQNSSDYVTKAKRKTGPFSTGPKKPTTTTTTPTTIATQQQQQQQHMYYDPTTPQTNYGYVLPNDHEYIPYYSDDTYPQNYNMEIYPTNNKHDVNKEEQLPLEILPQQHHFSYISHDALQVESTNYEKKLYMLEGHQQQQYTLYPKDLYNPSEENTTTEIKQYVV